MVITFKSVFYWIFLQDIDGEAEGPEFRSFVGLAPCGNNHLEDQPAMAGGQIKAILSKAKSVQWGLLLFVWIKCIIFCFAGKMHVKLLINKDRVNPSE